MNQSEKGKYLSDEKKNHLLCQQENKQNTQNTDLCLYGIERLFVSCILQNNVFPQMYSLCVLVLLQFS